MSNSQTRLNPDAVKALIHSTTYMRTPSGKTIVCEIMLVSGYSCIGTGRVIDLDNDNEERGKEAALAHAMEEVWSYAAVLMQDRMHRGEVPNVNQDLLAAYHNLHGGQPRLI
jgi:hypothetical protein